jgi:uncharacterized phage protein gp47/JayE
MAVEQVTRNEIIERLKQSITDYDSNVDVEYGPVKDLVIDPMSEELRRVNDTIYHVFRIQSLQNVAEMSEDELDAIAYNWQIVRKEGTFSTGTCWFQTSAPPATDIEIPLHTVVATAEINGIILTFYTTEVVVFLAGQQYVGSYWNAAEEVYEIAAPIRAVATGPDSDVAAGGIVTIISNIPTFSRIVNKEATFGGTERESNTRLAKRLMLAIQGVERASIEGLELWYEEQDGVIDASVIPAQDPIMTRSESGAVDVAVLGTEFAEYQETVVFNNLAVLFTKQPVKSVLSVIGTSGAYEEGVEWVFVKDTTSGYAGSVRALSRIEWRAIDTLPPIGEAITITYQYDKMIIDLQELSEEDDNKFLADILVKSAEQIDVQCAFTIKVYAGFVQSNVRQAVKDAVYAYINDLKLGQDVEQSDLVFEIRKVAGVDNVEIPFQVLKKESDPASTIPYDIVIEKNEYARVASSKIEVWSS